MTSSPANDMVATQCMQTWWRWLAASQWGIKWLKWLWMWWTWLLVPHGLLSVIQSQLLVSREWSHKENIPSEQQLCEGKYVFTHDEIKYKVWFANFTFYLKPFVTSIHPQSGPLAVALCNFHFSFWSRSYKMLDSAQDRTTAFLLPCGSLYLYLKRNVFITHSCSGFMTGAMFCFFLQQNAYETGGIGKNFFSMFDLNMDI